MCLPSQRDIKSSRRNRANAFYYCSIEGSSDSTQRPKMLERCPDDFYAAYSTKMAPLLFETLKEVCMHSRCPIWQAVALPGCCLYFTAIRQETNMDDCSTEKQPSRGTICVLKEVQTHIYTYTVCEHDFRDVPLFAYYYPNGPWRCCWVRYGHRPYEDPSSRL